jgi:flagellar hook-length control protein FliK
MPDMIHLPPPQQAGKHLAAGKGKSAAAPADEAGGGQPFANVLRGKCNAGPKPANGESDPQAKDQDGSAASAAGATDTEAQAAAAATAETPVAAAASVPTDPAAMLAAALLAAAPRPQRATAAGTAGTDTAVTSDAAGPKAGGDARAWLSQFTGEGKRPGAGKDAAAGVTAPAGGDAAGVTDKPAPKADAAARTDFSELLGQARTESSSMNSTQTSSTDLAASTLAMLAPAREALEAQRTATPRTATQIESPVGSPLFANEAAQRVTWLARNSIEHAEIRVTPPDMGPIQVTIDMHDNEATINFVVTQTDTRVALEDSLHQLEEMLAESGIALSQASVGQQDAGQSSAGGQSAGTNGPAGPRTGRQGGGDVDLSAGAEIRRPMQMRGLVDTFA